MTIKNGRLVPGSTMPLETSFADASGAALDPATVTFKLISPCQTETTYVYGTDAELVRSAAGVYRIDVVPDEPGRWTYQWVTTGPGSINEDSFIVRNSKFFKGYSGDYY
jgi:hypothetical protein